MSIKPIVLLPLPLENAEVWRQFRSFADRFAATWRANAPGIDVDLVVLCCKNLPSPDAQAIFTGLPVYDNNAVITKVFSAQIIQMLSITSAREAYTLGCQKKPLIEGPKKKEALCRRQKIA